MATTALQSFPRRRHAHTALDQRTLAEQRRAEEAAREKALYGNALPDAQLLRKIGYVVTGEKGKFRVGNKLLDKAGLVAMAERERRLIGKGASSTPATTTNGHKVGHVERLAPKKVPQGTLPAPRKLTGAAATSKAKAAQHSADLGKKPTIVWLGLELLTVDKSYQRQINSDGEAHIGRILKAFNWNCYQPIIVSDKCDGTFAVIDGQHRLEAARRHPLISALPCYIIDAPDIAQQAAIFVAVNSNRKALTSAQKFFGALAANDPNAVALAAICKAADVTILRMPPGRPIGPRELLSPLVCTRLIAKFGKRPAREAFTLLAETHRETPQAYRGATLTALTRIAADKGFVRDRLRVVLAKIDLNRLIAEAAVEAKGSPMAGALERILRAAVDKRKAA